MKNLSLSVLIILFGVFCLQAKAQTKQQPKKDNARSSILADGYEIQPQFPGGKEALLKFISKNLKLPSGEIEAQGKVIISFVVQKDGRTTDFNVDKSLHPAYDQEALRVLKSMPKWSPGHQYGRPVKCRYVIPINFSIPED